MPHTIVKNTFVGTPRVNGGIFKVPQTVTLPTDVITARPASAVRLGGVSDEGYTYTTERASKKNRDWNGDKVRSAQTSKDDTLVITFIEFLNPAVQSVVYGDANVTVVPATAARGTLISVRENSDILDHGAYIIDTVDGKVKRRRVVYDAQPDKVEGIGEKPGEWSVYKVTFDLFPNSQGDTSNIFTELDDKLVPSSWTAGVSGGAGTITWTVTRDGVSQSTSAQAYNVATTALDTALEALPLVGTGGATVTGTPGTTYGVVLANGGVLSAVAAGGASVIVAPV